MFQIRLTRMATMRSMLLGVVPIVLFLLGEVLAFQVPKPFSCKNSLISDEWREAVLKFHNDNRRRVAEDNKRQQENETREEDERVGHCSLVTQKKALPQAVYWLHYLEGQTRPLIRVWDCDLEHNAYLKICDPNTKISSTYAPTDMVTIGTNGGCDIIAETKTALQKWWAESASKDLSDANNLYSRAVKNFGRMATGEVKGFGCSYSNCNTKTGKNQLLCIYDYKAQANDPLYITADNDGEICMDCPVTECEHFLCQYEYTGATKANPQPSCKKDGMTFDMQTIATDMHNYYRRVLATGWAKDSNGYASRAKQLPALRYDCTTIGKQTLALIPCTKAESLNTITPTRGYSLNYHRESYKVSREETLKKAIKTWWGQLEKVDVDDEAMYTDSIKKNAKFFAAMALQEAKKVGCAVNECRKQGYTIAACQYDALPVDDTEMYEVGAPCTGCAKSSQTCEKVGGQPGALCVAGP